MELTEEQRQRRREGGRLGGLAKVPKGFAKMNPERLRELSIKARQKQLNRKAHADSDAAQHE